VETPSSPRPDTSPPAAGGKRPATAGAVLLLAIVAVVAALFWPRSEGARRAVPGGFLIDAAGRPQPLGRELKPVTLVHFWATWCAPCLTEIPALLESARALRDERFGLILVAVADTPEAAERFVGSADFPLLFDPGWDVAHRFGTEKLPETHLVVDGEVVDSFVGATDWRDPAIRARIQKWTAAPPSANP
jgi:thiol-disulfide isomerase/thioredoxin